MNETMVLLRWAGSKRQIVPVLGQYWRAHHRRYVEPFAGSAALFFFLRPRKALLGDLNADLIATYRAIRDNPTGVAKAINQLPPADRSVYYALRAASPKELAREERAARFVYLNRYCFNGLYRTNSRGVFNVPYGGDRSGSLPNPDQITAVAKLLRRCTFVVGDFEATLAKVRQGDLVYLDPPYWVADRRVFREYSSSIFSNEDLGRLQAHLERLETLQIDYVLSYADAPEAELLGDGRCVRRTTVRRNIAGFSGGRRRSAELIITPPYLRQRESS